jgi:hypothetical protein
MLGVIRIWPFKTCNLGVPSLELQNPLTAPWTFLLKVLCSKMKNEQIVWSTNFCWEVRVIMVHMVAQLIIRSKAFWKSILVVCSKPWATSLTFNFCIEPYVVGFVLYEVKTHYGGDKIVVTLYYFLGVPCLNFNHVIIWRIFTMFLHIMVGQNPNK